MDDKRTDQDTTSLEDILADEQLHQLLREQSREEPVPPPAGTQRSDRAIIALMATACVLCLGIIAVLGYWLTFLR